MSLPNVNISLGNGNLGITAPSEDGISGIIVSGIAVAGKFALGDVIGPLYSIDDSVALGINAAYDSTNSVLAYQHIKDFYDYAGAGTELYVMVVAQTVTMADLCDSSKSYAAKMLSDKQGRIRMIAITRVPDAAYLAAVTYANQFEMDLTTAITNAQALAVSEFNKYRPVSFILEGRNWQGNASSSLNLRSSTGPLANKVSVVIGNDNDVAVSATYKNKYAAAGAALGKAAGLPVQRNIGRVKSLKSKIVNAGYSNGTAYIAQSDTNRDTLDTFGYIFLRTYPGAVDGFFWNDDHTATVITDDYGQLSSVRTIHKGARIARIVYVLNINDDVEVNANGTLDAAVIKSYQADIVSKLNSDMKAKGEVSFASCFVDPAQVVGNTRKVVTKVSIRKKTSVRQIDVTLGFEAIQ